MRFIAAITAFVVAASAAAVPQPQAASSTCNNTACLADLAAAGIDCVGKLKKLGLAKCALSAGIALGQVNGCRGCFDIGLADKGTCQKAGEVCPPIGTSMAYCIGQCNREIFMGAGPLQTREYCLEHCRNNCGCN